MSFLQRGQIFSSAAEYFGQSSLIMLERVGNAATLIHDCSAPCIFSADKKETIPKSS